MNTNTNPTRTRGARAQVLSESGLIELGAMLTYIAHPEAARFGAGPQPQVLIAADRGEPTVIDGNGIGHQMDDNGMIALAYEVDGEPITVKVDLDTVDSLLNGKVIDLADAIASGPEGDRRHAEWWGRFDVDYNPEPAEGEQAYCNFCDGAMERDAEGDGPACPRCD